MKNSNISISPIKLLISVSVFIILILTPSCMENIDVNLNSANPQIVVEGTIVAGKKAIIKITKSININDSTLFPVVSNANVIISDNAGSSEKLTEITPGIYSSSSLTGVIGRIYHLSVNAENKTISSDCKIPEQISFDSLNVVEIKSGFGFGNQTGNTQMPDIIYNLKIKYKDPESTKNYYRFIVYVNGTPIGNNSVYDDRLYNGIETLRTLVLYNQITKPGYKISVEMQCISSSVFNYFESMSNSRMGPQNSTTPSNPYTNLTNAVLGYFNACTSETKDYIVNN